MSASSSAMLRAWGIALNTDAAKTFAGVVQENTGLEFDARGTVHLWGSEDVRHGQVKPPSVMGIPVQRRVVRLHFLHQAGWWGQEGAQVRAYSRHHPTDEHREPHLLRRCHRVSLPFRAPPNLMNRAWSHCSSARPWLRQTPFEQCLRPPISLSSCRTRL